MIALYAHNELPLVEPGNHAEFTLKTYPGRVIKAKVDSIVWAQGQGQVTQSGALPQTGAYPQAPGRFPVKFEVDERDRDLFLAAGAVGQARSTPNMRGDPHPAHGDPAHRHHHRLPRAEAALMRAHVHARGIVAAAARGRRGGLRAQPAADGGRTAEAGAAAHGVPAAWKAGGGAAAPVADRWLASFNDPALSALVAEALAYNADLQVAAARVEQAAGYVKVASASLLPSVGVAGMGGGKSGGSGGLDGVLLNASLELDIWGRVRYGEAAAEAQSAAAGGRLRLCAPVAGGDGRQELVPGDRGRTAARDRAGSAALDRGAAAQSRRTACASATATSRRWRKRARTPATIATACGRSNWRASRRCARSNCSSAAIRQRRSRSRSACRRCRRRCRSACRRELLERRPDVIAAERRVAAAFDRVGEARAAQLPRISLTAGGSSVSSDLIVLKDTSNPIWSLGANLLAPLYQGGALRAQVEIRTAEQKQAVAEYARAGQRAFGEVEDALAAENALRDREAHPRRPRSATASARSSSRESSIASAVRRPARGRAEPARAVLGPHGAAARADASGSRSA